MSKHSDIFENDILAQDEALLPLLLIDRTRSTEEKPHNLIWATDNYVQRGEGYQEWDEITVGAVTGDNGLVLRPRVNKSREEQERRSRDKAEVFTPAWICNKQNNLIDAAWFGGTSPFNVEEEKGWTANTDSIPFPTTDGKTWQDYVKDTRLEMACGEAPYLVSRYNVVTGEDIPVDDRIGLLDRKLRVVGENAADAKEWFKWAVEAYRSIYGFEWQGDNLVLAREAMLYTFIDYHVARFGKMPTKAQTRKIAEIVSWNLWQMDGLKGVIPGSCYNKVTKEYTLFGEVIEHVEPCEGCEKDDLFKHNGIYCRIMDWDKRKTIRFIDLLKK
ncbi:MAG: restriction endonuclease subunit M [Bacteroidales bacterium]|nr:restriction endonuclease subunit M [Bacteroidales bacterium]